MLALVVILAGLQGSPAVADPLAPARAGKMQCHMPNTATKSCLSLASYVFAADGSISNKAEILLAPQMGLTMTTVSPVSVKNGAICGQLSDLSDAAFAMNGQAAPPQVADTIRQQVGQALAPMMGKEICTTYKPDGADFVTSSTIDGQPAPQLGSQKVMWVAPGDGYGARP